MSNTEAITELAEAMNNIEKARKKAEEDVAKTEIENLEVMCQDCMNGLVSDLISDDTYISYIRKG